MQIFNVRPKALQMLREIAKLSPKSAGELSEFLGAHLESLLTPSEAYALVMANPIAGLEAESAFGWFDTLLPFIFDVLPSASDADEVANGLTAAAQRLAAGTEGGVLSSASAKKLRANLLVIFDNPTTKLKAKSLRLLNTHERKLSKCEIYSDIRPVFRVDGKVEVEAAVVYHTLRLEHSGPEDVLSFALDSHDLAQLREVVVRAIEKEKALSALIGKAGVEQVKVS